MSLSKWQARAIGALVALLLVLCGSAAALREVSLASPFPQRVVNAVGCDLCSHVITNAAYLVLRRQQRLARENFPLRDNDVLEAMENLCIPLTEEGRWMRQVAVRIVEETVGEDLYAVVRPVVLQDFAECKESCRTAEQVCNDVIDSTAADQLPAILLAEAKKMPVSDDKKQLTEWLTLIGKRASSAICPTLKMCVNQAGYQQEAWDEYGENMPELLAVDVQETVKESDMENDKILDELKRKQNTAAELFTRDEILKLKSAIAKGDREAAERIDSKVKKLSDEEFEELKAIYSSQTDDDGDADAL